MSRTVAGKSGKRILSGVILTRAVLGLAAVAVVLPVVPARADSATTQPVAAARGGKEIYTDFQKVEKEVAAITSKDKAMTTPASRAAIADTVIPMYQKELTLLDELAHSVSMPARQLSMMKQNPTAMLYLFGDKQTVSSVDAAADATDSPTTAADALATRVIARWSGLDDNDVAGQNAVADELIKADQAHPGNGQLASITFSIASSAATRDTTKRLYGQITDKMESDMADRLKPMIESDTKLWAMENKPLIVSGKTVDGKDFSTADWKGKVVLVDFWATWCGPCVAGLPDVIKTYGEYHDKGLEILGVSNDVSSEPLVKFVAKKQMPWPELFDADAAANHKWNSVTQGYGINAIPRMFLIDKAGILRSVEARSKMGVLIPKLLAE